MFGLGAIAGLTASRPSPPPTVVSQVRSSLAPHLGKLAQPLMLNGRPQLDPKPQAAEVWECQVAVVGGSLGGGWRRRPRPWRRGPKPV